MIHITCDRCKCNLTQFQVCTLEQNSIHLLTGYAQMENPDLCQKCFDAFWDGLTETITQWKLNK